ncbi:MAG TPA: PKD domain-containing protein [Methanofastidiosum sp.]|jgi:WD40 repeat protein|nr:PKD domain-containing protein [Methanofastidiosum sp.]HQK85901.1 PKD domain-containing protein [Methanofastidiosum sp.]
MKKLKLKLIAMSLLFLMTIHVMGIMGEEKIDETLCYPIPDTVRSLSLVSNGFYTAAAGVGENPEIFITDPYGVVWACPKRALSILLTLDGKYTVVGMHDGVELYDNSNAVDTTITKVIITIKSLSSFTKGQTITYSAQVFPPRTREIVITERTCNPLWKYITNEEVRIMSVSDTASHILAASGDTLYVIDKQGKLIWKYSLNSKVTDTEIAGRYIVTSSQDTVYFFNITGDLLWTYRVNGIPEKLVLSMTGPYVGVGTNSGNIYQIDKNGVLVFNYKHNKSIRGLSITNTGSYLVAGSTDGYILFFNNKGTKLWSYKTNGGVNFVDISSQGQYIAAGADRDSYYLFNWNGQKIWAKTNPENYFWSIQVQDDGKGLFAGSGKYMGGNLEMKLSNNVCFFNTEQFAMAGDAPDKNIHTIPTESTQPPSQTTNISPIANAGNDFETKVGEAIRFDGTKSVDEDGNIVSYHWDFGDGKTSIDPKPLHQYTSAGVYKVTLIVTDDKGSKGEDVLYVTVKESQPQSPMKGVPGFELPALLGGSITAYFILSRRKRN